VQQNLGVALASLGTLEPASGNLAQAQTSCDAALQVYTPAREPLEWAETQYDIGRVHTELSKTEGGDMHALAAVDAYHLALTVQTRERDPVGWGLTQGALAATLETLADDEMDEANLNESAFNKLQALSEDHLKQAVAASQSASLECSRSRAPFEWARNQVLLGYALEKLGQGDSEAQRLQQSVEVFRQALQVQTSASDHLAWAASESQLGDALRSIGRA
jgi:tetratricopeptide (TPR) repeat protein